MRVRTTEGGRLVAILSPAEKEARKQLDLYIRIGYSFEAAMMKVRYQHPRLGQEFFDWLRD